ncbi:hypothetical protein [Pseudomonas palleroniana]|nr:hypothetical protein [Pseudomonas palleroniana]MBI6909762.1 hypothetical protein [Pseudomonas palleroniana]
METTENSVTFENLCDYIEAMDGEQKACRGVTNNALLIPVQAKRASQDG